MIDLRKRLMQGYGAALALPGYAPGEGQMGNVGFGDITALLALFWLLHSVRNLSLTAGDTRGRIGRMGRPLRVRVELR